MEYECLQEIDDMELIKLVEANCCLYNKRIRKFKTADKKDIWTQIGAALTNKKTGDQAQRRWDSLRTMWSCQHKKYYKQGRLGSGASQDTQEFQYYGEMSFLIPHYSSQQTKSNMKRSVSCISNDESSESQIVINKPSPIVIDSSSIQDSQDTDFDTAQFDVDMYEFLSLDNDENWLQQSSQEKNEMHKSHTEDRVPLSSTAHAVLNKMSSKQSLFNKTGTLEKYKLKENKNVVVPEPDNFYKKRKVNIDNYIHTSAQSLEKMANTIENIVSQKAVEKAAPKAHVSESDDIDKDISDMLKCAYVGLKQVKSDMRFNCIVDVLKVINKYKEQELQNND
ncbi:hypothetical protein ALC62_11483 [Cyphomyrmex costatus]|uniref:MADF domain-containing protein n=1 Tax=Cyphomyrmex costatus TaxID=456900 RepID=A0A151ICR3_9HYME|nr:hypothetical protein ALC62_11483 [Cyphomyrmex costatus]